MLLGAAGAETSGLHLDCTVFELRRKHFRMHFVLRLVVPAKRGGQLEQHFGILVRPSDGTVFAVVFRDEADMRLSEMQPSGTSSASNSAENLAR